MPIYSGNGDDGSTGLASGERVPKSSARPEACGSVDELNAHLGAVIACLPGNDSLLADELVRIQNDLFTIGALISSLPGSSIRSKIDPIENTAIQHIEQAIDRLEQQLPALTRFILPNGHPAAIQAHIARTVCRRAERRVVQLILEEYDAGLATAQIYLNRLADYLFVCARWCNHQAGVKEATIHRKNK
jgi:cob(I)alamin adenosyltransferase